MMRRSKSVVGKGFKAALLGSAFLWQATAAQAISVTEAIEVALSTNPDIGIVASNREAVDQELRQARGLYLPQIDVSAGYGTGFIDDISVRNDGNEPRTQNPHEVILTLQQRLFDGFEASSTVERGGSSLMRQASIVRLESVLVTG